MFRENFKLLSYCSDLINRHQQNWRSKANTLLKLEGRLYMNCVLSPLFPGHKEEETVRGGRRLTDTDIWHDPRRPHALLITFQQTPFPSSFLFKSFFFWPILSCIRQANTFLYAEVYCLPHFISIPILIYKRCLQINMTQRTLLHWENKAIN